jgi:hypothetical protein
MKKWIALVALVVGTTLASAQTPPAGSAQPAAGSAQPAAGSAGSAQAPEQIKMPVPPPAPPSADAAVLRKTCTDAMNADPAFAKSIIATVDKQLDQQTIDVHTQAAYHVAKNHRHVIYAYAAMWIIAAAFVAFLWLRQQKLKAELAQLRADLDAAAKDS